MKVFAKFDEIPSMSLQDIKGTKRYGHNFFRSDGRMDGRTDNLKKTVYPPTNTVCGGIMSDFRPHLSEFFHKLTYTERFTLI